VQLLIGLAAALGGGGVAFGLRNLTIQLAAMLLLFLQRGAVQRFLREAPRALVALVLLTLALPLMQLAPLPPAMWQNLPGREPVLAAFAIAGIPADSWFPLSVDRGRTLTAFLGLLAPAAIIAVGSVLGREEKAAIARFTALTALAALMLGIFQVSTANTAALLFPITPKPDVMYATFANRNSTAALFVLALLLLAAAPWWKSRADLLIAVAGGALLALGAVLTQSRSGMVLLVLALAFAALRAGMAALARRRGARAGSGDGLPRPVWIAAVVGTALVAVAVIASATMGGRAADSLDRFGDTETDRPEMWEDAAFAAREYWPAGSGMGTFDEAFQLHESLEYISPRRAGRAHSDVLEIVIEAGILGAALAVFWLLWCAWAAGRAPAYWRWTALGAGTGVLALLLQSLLDYPLRNQTLLCVAAVFVVLLAHRKGHSA
jgi:O-antigen ligase